MGEAKVKNYKNTYLVNFEVFTTRKTVNERITLNHLLNTLTNLITLIVLILELLQSLF